MKGKSADIIRLRHILQAIQEIEDYITDSSLEIFMKNSMMRYASIKQIEIIGEAANHLSDQTRDAFPEIQWRRIIGLRHVLVHEYFGIDTILIWQIISKDIPELKASIYEVILSLEHQ